MKKDKRMSENERFTNFEEKILDNANLSPTYMGFSYNEKKKLFTGIELINVLRECVKEKNKELLKIKKMINKFAVDKEVTQK